MIQLDKWSREVYTSPHHLRANQEFRLRSQNISLNDHHPISSPTQLRRICGFVTQEDNPLPLLTVKETLMFSARFRLLEG
ncbi:hypothetical protein H6P81_021748 [Aristolochia fimbriata]|uniref:Uncharacterized protein n=1 Tax=Aristolochia fimbriata TaxID=158543 RepID=A0AAV7DP35_ARIFI|nr:hypothetical protein H6P81_021748 [Aristolochia fimbriata]